MAVVVSPARRHLSLLRRHLSSPAAPPPISPATARSLLRAEFDPDKAVSILSSITDSYSAPANARAALDLTVRRLAKSRRFAEINSLIESRKKPPTAANEPHIATLIISYGTARMLPDAIRTFNEIPAPTAVSFNALLTACIRAKLPRRVPALFADIPTKHSIVPDVIAYSILIKSLCLAGDSTKAFHTLQEMKEKGIEITIGIHTTLLDSLYKEGKLEEADKLWKEMPSPDVPAYNVRVMHHALHGELDEVLAVISEIESAGLKPDAITYNFLMTSYHKNGRFEDAKGVYEGLKMKDSGPNAATFKNFLYFCCRNGDLDLGMEVYRQSMKKNKTPEFRTMSLFVEELVKASRVDEAREVVVEVKKKFPKNLVGGWLRLEKKLGQNVVEAVPDGAEAA